MEAKVHIELTLNAGEALDSALASLVGTEPATPRAPEKKAEAPSSEQPSAQKAAPAPKKKEEKEDKAAAATGEKEPSNTGKTAPAPSWDEVVKAAKVKMDAGMRDEVSKVFFGHCESGLLKDIPEGEYAEVLAEIEALA